MNPHDCNSHKHLKLARLPIPPFLRSSPFARIYKLYSFYIPVSRTFFKKSPGYPGEPRDEITRSHRLVPGDLLCVRKKGLEPSRYCYHKILSLARLPIPTLPHRAFFNALCYIIKNAIVCQGGFSKWSLDSVPASLW